MGEVHQLGLPGAIAPQGLGEIDHHVAAVLPGAKDAHLGVALRLDRSIEKTDPWMAAAGIGQDPDPAAGIPPRLAGGARRQGLEQAPHGRAAQPSGGRSLLRTVTMLPHVLQPVPELHVWPARGTPAAGRRQQEQTQGKDRSDWRASRCAPHSLPALKKPPKSGASSPKVCSRSASGAPPAPTDTGTLKTTPATLQAPASSQ